MNVNLSTFPRNRDEALTMLHLASQNLDNMTPEELAEYYSQTLLKIEMNFAEQRDKFDQRHR